MDFMVPMSSSYLIRGQDALAKYPDFKLVGRDADLKKLSSILIRKEANSVLLVGPEGVGTTALCLGLQASKSDPDAPFDIVAKRLHWLDTDGLFSTGDCQKINELFQKAMDELTQTPDSILIIEDTRDFIEASRNSGNSHFINAITMAVKGNKTQVILEVRDGDLDQVLKWHSDLRESYTLLDLEEPVGEDLKKIVEGISASLAKHHGIPVPPEAQQAAIDLTSKYRTDDGVLPVAQPKRSGALLDRALSTYRLEAHKQPPGLSVLQQLLAHAASAEGAQSVQREIDTTLLEWNANQDEIKRLYGEQRKGEIQIITLKDELAKVLKEEDERRSNSNPEHIEQAPRRIGLFAAAASKGGFDSEQVADIKSRISKFEAELAINREAFHKLTEEINKDLKLSRTFVVAEFSRISGISANKLDEDERAILRNLETTLETDVFGQKEAITKVSNAIKVARVGRRNRSKPQAAFMFLGPSGVGKTQVAKSIAKALKGDERAMLRLDMSEYMEKHAVAKLIGAPPGYEGFEAGGILTNAMRKDRSRIILFDEIEKAHPDVFNILLQVLDDGRLTDNIGRTASFDEAIIICTTNTGQPHFLDQNMSFEDAERLALLDLDNTYRAEFLNRFNGRQNILCFKRLYLDSIEKIVRRELDDLDAAYTSEGVKSVIDSAAIKSFCADHYDARVGARGLPGYIQSNLEPIIVDRILDTPNSHGVFKIDYNRSKRVFDVKFEEAA
jgi:ATP-dependent Clp protease ATP-binding subunit ClpB